MARFFVYSTKEAAAALKEAHIPYRVHGEYCISVNNDDYSTAVEAFFRNDVSFQPEYRRYFSLQDSWRLALLPHAPHLLRKRFRIHLTAID